jgi:short-subunit dehydrogenase
MATALVTGATAGIGYSYAQLLAKEGFDLVLVARDLPRLNKVAKELSKTFGVKVSSVAKEQELLDVLVTAPMRLTHAVLPGMVKRDSGVIVNVSSVASFIAGGTYSAAKSYLTVFSEYLHTELRETNIRVSALCPGFTRTEFHSRGKMNMTKLPNYMWCTTDQVVKKSWRYAKAGKVICVPGWQYLLLSIVARIAPRPIVRKIGMNVRRKQRIK